MTFLDCLNSLKCDFTQNWSGGKIIKFQQIQALSSHFESFWSIVNSKDGEETPKAAAASSSPN